jgi:hypothetical protein
MEEVEEHAWNVSMFFYNEEILGESSMIPSDPNSHESGLFATSYSHEKDFSHDAIVEVHESRSSRNTDGHPYDGLGSETTGYFTVSSVSRACQDEQPIFREETITSETMGSHGQAANRQEIALASKDFESVRVESRLREKNLLYRLLGMDSDKTYQQKSSELENLMQSPRTENSDVKLVYFNRTQRLHVVALLHKGNKLISVKRGLYSSQRRYPPRFFTPNGFNNYLAAEKIVDHGDVLIGCTVTVQEMQRI